jgi:hypothetical protein
LHVERVAGLVRHPAPVADQARVIEAVRFSFGVKRRSGDRVTPLAAILQSEQAEPDTGKARPQPPTPAGVVQRALA